MENLNLEELNAVITDLEKILEKVKAQNDMSLEREIAVIQRDIRNAKAQQLLKQLLAIEQETNEELKKLNLKTMKYYREHRHLFPNEFERAKIIKAEKAKKYFQGKESKRLEKSVEA